MVTRNLIIGDVHGMYDELIKLLGLARERGPVDSVIFVGDLIDKGPRSQEVVAFVRYLANDPNGNVVLVTGNHEEKALRARANPERVSVHPKYREAFDSMTDEDWAYLETGRLFFRIGNAVVIHAGVTPLVDKLPTDEEYNALSKRKRKVYDEMLRVRYVCKDTGAFRKLGTQERGDPFWAETYDGRFGHIYFGHEPFFEKEQPVQFPHATALDLGACFGGCLCGVIVDELGVVSEDPIVVKATESYDNPFRREE